MTRFFFNLCGVFNVDDILGLRFETELQAYRAGEKFADDLAEARPALCGSSWVAVACEDSKNTLYVSVGVVPA